MNNTNGIIVTDSMEMIDALLLEQRQFVETRQEELEMEFLPHVITSTDGNEHNTDLISYDMIKNRVIYLNGAVNGESALSVITQLRYLAAKSDKDIYLVINSPGGAVSDGLAIYDVMNEIPCAVVTVATGMAASMGSFLLAAGSPGKRYATPSTEIMIHQPLGGVVIYLCILSAEEILLGVMTRIIWTRQNESFLYSINKLEENEFINQKG